MTFQIVNARILPAGTTEVTARVGLTSYFRDERNKSYRYHTFAELVMTEIGVTYGVTDRVTVDASIPEPVPRLRFQPSVYQQV